MTDLVLVRKKVWETAVEAAADQAQIAPRSRQSRLMLSLLTMAHNRHVGLPPTAAAGLANALLNDRNRPLATPWDAVVKRLQDELLTVTHENRNNTYRIALQAQHFGVLLNASFSYTVFRLALPLVERACGQVGQTLLFCEDDKGVDSPSPSAYAEYEKQVSAAIVALAQDETEATAVFWKDRAITLKTITQTGGMTAEQTALPAVDPPALGLLTRLKPEVENGRPHTQRLLTPTQRQKLHNPRLREAGVQGIYITRREDELHRMLVSEMTYPTVLRLDRLLNTGYLASERPPIPIKLRDVLIVGMLPGALQGQLCADFIKTCWFDFVMRISRLLRQSGLNDSEFRWIEGDRFGRTRTRSVLLRRLPEIDIPTDNIDLDTYRQQFLTALRWLPGYIDNLADWGDFTAASSQTVESEIENDLDEWSQMRQWFGQAWRGQKELAAWEEGDDGVSGGGNEYSMDDLEVEKFAFISMMPFVPTALLPDEERKISPHLDIGRTFRFGGRGGRSVAVTAVPPQIDDGEAWKFLARGWHTTHLFKQDAESVDDADYVEAITVQKIAGQLEKLWIEQFVKEMKRG